MFLFFTVMRLTKPTLMVHQPLGCDPRDLPGDSLANMAKKDLAVDPMLPNFALGELLTLPQNFG